MTNLDTLRTNFANACVSVVAAEAVEIAAANAYAIATGDRLKAEDARERAYSELLFALKEAHID